MGTDRGTAGLDRTRPSKCHIKGRNLAASTLGLRQRKPGKVPSAGGFPFAFPSFPSLSSLARKLAHSLVPACSVRSRRACDKSEGARHTKVEHDTTETQRNTAQPSTTQLEHSACAKRFRRASSGPVVPDRAQD